jgi:hypothetical protein
VLLLGLLLRLPAVLLEQELRRQAAYQSRTPKATELRIVVVRR